MAFKYREGVQNERINQTGRDLGRSPVRLPAPRTWTPSSSRPGSGGIRWDQVGSGSQWQAANSRQLFSWQEVLSAEFWGRAESSQGTAFEGLSVSEGRLRLAPVTKDHVPVTVSSLYHLFDTYRIFHMRSHQFFLSLVSLRVLVLVSRVFFFSLFQLAAVHSHQLWYFLFLLYVVFHQEFGLSASITYKTTSSPRLDSFLTVWLLYWGLGPILELTPLPCFLT